LTIIAVDLSKVSPIFEGQRIVGQSGEGERLRRQSSEGVLLRNC